MLTYKQYITEKFVNAVITKADNADLRARYAQQVWDILQASYAKIGGIKGSGFGSVQDMVDNIPFWKMIVQGGVVHAVVMYKDKGGRKSVAMGSNGSEYAKKNLAALLRDDIKRSYGEKSKAALGSLLKEVPWEVLQAFVKTPAEAQKILGEPVTAISSMKDEDIPEDGRITLAKNPHLTPYAYVREIGGKSTFKLMIGSPGHSIQ